MLTILRQFVSGNLTVFTFIAYLASVSFVVFCATPLHEFAHAKVAVLLGDDTPLLSGRCTINPKAHINPIGAVMIFLFGFGYAKPVEVRMRNFKNPKRDMTIVALAGPLCNLLQAVVYLFLYALLSNVIGINNVVLASCGLFLQFAATININLAVFNLIPVPPLDGSRLLTALLPSKYYFKLMQYERYISIAIIVLLFTGILTVPLSFLSGLVYSGISFLVNLPF